MANYWWTDYDALFDSEELPFAEAIHVYFSGFQLVYFYEFVSDTNQVVIDALLQQATSGSQPQISDFAYRLTQKAIAVTASGEDEKWQEFKSLWSPNLQPAVQVIIDKARIGSTPAVLFDDFAAWDNATHAQNVLNLYTAEYDFWTPYINYFKGRANVFQNGWSQWLAGLSGDYKIAMAEFTENITYGGITGLENYIDFDVFKTLDPALFRSTIIFNGLGFPLRYMMRYLSQQIRENLNQVFDGSYITEEQRRQAFVLLFRPEIQQGIQSYIDTLISKTYITSFDGLNSIPGIISFGINRNASAGVGVAQQDQMVVLRYALPLENHNLEAGDVLALEINGAARIYFTYAGLFSVADELSTFINAATTGDWSTVNASNVLGSPVITANSDNVPFVVKPISIIETIVGYLTPDTNASELSPNHPLYTGIVQMILNDANTIDAKRIQVVKTAKGVIYYRDVNDRLQPSSNAIVRFSDIDDIDNPIDLGKYITGQDGAFNFTYTLENSNKTQKKIRIQANDQSGNNLLITTDEDPNLFIDAANGTFEGGTPPDYIAWNLTKGTDIKITSGDTRGSELLTNGDFKSDRGDWYIDYPQTSLIFGYIINERLVFTGPITSTELYSPNFLTIGKTYSFTINILFVDFSPSFTVKDLNDNLLFSANTQGVHSFEFTAETLAIHIKGNHITVDYFSIKEVLTLSTYQGNFTPNFYLDANTATDNFIFKGDTTIAVTAHTDYQLEAYLYFNDSILKPDAAINSGLILLPTSLDLEDMTQAVVLNGDQHIDFVSDVVKSSKDTMKGQWLRLYSTFNTGAATSIQIGLFFQGDIADLKPHFEFMIDSVRVTQAAALSKDLTLLVDSTHSLSVVANSMLNSTIDAALAAVAAASDPQVTNVFPGNVHIGDLFILDLNHQGTVSFKATAATAVNVVAGLAAAMIAESADIAITVQTAAGPFDQQEDYLTISNVKVGQVFTLRLNDSDSVTYVATTTSADDVTTGLSAAIVKQEANATITVAQTADVTLPQIIHLTPLNLHTGNQFIITINGKDPIQYTTLSTTVSTLCIALANAMNAAGGEWAKVSAVDHVSGSYVIITAKSNNVRFSIEQVGGTWKSVHATNDTANDRVKLKAIDNNVSFTVRQLRGTFQSVYPTTFSDHLTVTANADNTPFNLYVQVATGKQASLPLDTILRSFDFPIPPMVQDALRYQGIITVDDILSKGGLKLSMDAKLDIKVTQKAATSVKQITQIQLLQVQKGNIISFTINGTDVIGYVVTTDVLGDILTALTALINDATGGWTAVTATAVALNTISVEANSNNVAFTIEQTMAGEGEAVKYIDSITSLHSVIKDLDVAEDKQIAVIDALMKAGLQSAFSLLAVPKEEFAMTINHIIGDFNTARLFEVAMARKAYTQQLISSLAPSTQTLSGLDPGTGALLGSVLKESCACDDCETAVSPLAYLTDLTNYIIKNVVSNGNQNLTVNFLNNRFYQDFTELPASCEDVINRVCQLRVATEIMRRYLAAQAPTGTALTNLHDQIREYLNDLYNQLLVSFGTSYDEIRLTLDEEDKRSLALRLEIDYDSDPDFLNKLFMSPAVLSMDSWTDYKKANNKEIHALIDALSTSLSPLTFDQFRELTPGALRTLLIALPYNNSFVQAFAGHIIDTANEVLDEVNALSMVNPLKKQLMWDMLVYQLTQKFSMPFKSTFETFVSAYRTIFKEYDSNSNDWGVFYWLIINPGYPREVLINNVANTFNAMLGASYLDLWSPLASALLSKIEDTSISEQDIEELFGVMDSSRDVYSDGAKINDDTNILKRWNIRGVQWGRNTDKQGYIYVYLNEGDTSIELYRDASRDEEFKVGVALPDASAKFIISEFNDSGLTGQIVVAELDATAEIAISAIPLLLSWKLTGLRALWGTSDRFADTPVVDPDLVQPSDILYPYDIDTVTPTKAVDFWQKRKEELADQYDDYKAAQIAADQFHTYGSSGSGATQLNDPNGIGLDAAGNLFIADTTNNRIQKLAGSTISTLTNTGVSAPKQLLVTSNDKIIAAISGSSVVKQFNSSSGAEEWSFGSSGSVLGTFTGAYGVALGTKNDLFVTDHATTAESHTGRIQRFTLPYNYTSYTQIATLTIKQITAAASGVKQVSNVTPSKISVGDTFKLTLQGTGSVTYVATSNVVQEVVNALEYLIGLESWSSINVVNKETYLEFTANAANTPFTLTYESVPFVTAANIAVDNDGNRYVSDRYNGRVLKLNENGELLKVFGNASGLANQAQALLRFDEGTGTTLRDSAGNSSAHNGTTHGTVEWKGDETFSNALQLVTNAYVSIPTAITLDNGTFAERSVELWFKANGTSDRQVLYKHGSSTQGMSIYLYSGELYAGIYGTSGGDWSNFISTKRVESDKWHHLTVLFDNSPVSGTNKFRAYLDGIEFLTDTQGNSGTGIEATSNGLYLGASLGNIKFADTTGSSTGYYFIGRIAHFRIWNRALDQNEINMLVIKVEDRDGSLYLPGPLALDKAGNLYVGDTGNSRVVKFDASGTFVTKIGAGYGSSEGTFNSIDVLTVDKLNATLYVSDTTLNRVQKFNDLGFLSSLTASPAFSNPSGLAVDGEGTLYVADQGHSKVRLYNSNGIELSEITEFDEAGSPVSFSAPAALSIDNKGNLIVFDEALYKLVLLKKTETLYVLYGGPWTLTSISNASIGIDSDNYVYLGYGDNYIRLRFPEQITTITIPAGITLANAFFNTPCGLATDLNGNIWVADKSHHRILKLTPQGTYLNDIGKADHTTGTGNGEFNNPEYVTVDESGNLYVSDTGNNRIQKFDSSGEYLCQWETNAFSSAQNASTGLVLNKDRKLFVAQRGADAIYAFDSMQGMGGAIYTALGFSLSDLMLIYLTEKQGTDISTQLSDASLSYEGYRRLLALAGMADRRIELLDQQLSDLYNVLVRAYKESKFTVWKKEEGDAGIILSQDHFVIPLIQQEEDLVFNEWLVSSKERRNWINTLKSRIEQENAMKAQYEETLSDVEGEYLIRLRDILINASNFTGTTLEQKAQFGSNKLLIDLKNACCQKTTRISQALEVLQNLMWGLHNGILSDTIPDLRIREGIDFDEEWRWMGSYSTWKAAQFVFLYPENLLQPAYNTNQSGGFKEFIENLQMNPQLSVGTLKDYVADYYDYFDDVNSLQMLDSIQAPTLIDKEVKEIRGEQSSTFKNYIYLFARGSKTNSLYWTKLSSTSPYEQVDFWNKIDVEDGSSLKLIRVVRVRFPDDKIYLVIFLLDDRTDTPKLLYVKYDLQSGDWKLEPVEVDIPDFDDGFGNIAGKFRGLFINRNNSCYDILRKNDGTFSGDGTTQIEIFVQRGVMQIPYRFDKELKKLKQIDLKTDWPAGFYAQRNAIGRPDYKVTNIFSINELHSFYVDSETNAKKPAYYIGGSKLNLDPGWTPDILVASTTWPDSLDWRTYRDVHLYRRTQNGLNSLYYIVFKVQDGIIQNGTAVTGNNVIVPTVESASYFSSATYISNGFISDNYGVGDGISCVMIYQAPNGSIQIAEPYLKTVAGKPKLFFLDNPDIANVFDKVQINQYPQPTNSDLRLYKSAVSQVYNMAKTNNKFVQRMVEELYYSLPMSAALALQKRGLYEEALKWYRQVYDFSQSDINSRVIYQGLQENSDDHLIDDFSKENASRTLYLPVYGNTFSIIKNPNTAVGVGNTSPTVGSYPGTYEVNGGLVYKLDPNHEIDLDNPGFSLYVYKEIYSSVPENFYIEVGKANNDLTYYALFKATYSGAGWHKLNFEFVNKGGLPLASVNSLKIKTSNSYFPNKASTPIYFFDDFAYKKKVATTFEKSTDWLSDPINPHALAATRSGAYLRYTVLSIASCLIEYADSEFTQDNVESVPRARLLYENALDLMRGQGLGGTQELCREAVNAFNPVFTEEWNPVWLEIRNDLYKVKGRSELNILLADIKTVINDTGSENDKLKIIRNLVDVAISDPDVFKKVSQGIDVNDQVVSDLYLAIQSNRHTQDYMNAVSAAAKMNYLDTINRVTGVKTEVLLSDKVFDNANNTVLSQLIRLDSSITSGDISLDMITGSVDDLEDWMVAGGAAGASTQYALKDLNTALARTSKYTINYKPSTNFTFCIPSNPLVEAYRLNAEINLFKIRSCRNISGEVRELDPFAAAISVASGLPNVNGGAAGSGAEIRTFSPSQYRYETLIDRAKQLVQIAQQIEASLLATLEKLDAERYSMLKAKQDLSLSKAGIKLQDLRTREAESGVRLAELQKERAELQYDHFTSLINEGLLSSEQSSLDFLQSSIVLNGIVANLQILAGILGGTTISVGMGAGVSTNLGAAIAGTAQSLATLANISSQYSSLSAMTASFERRNQEWKFQKDLAQKDVAIGGQQIKIAKDQLAVVGQERNIAQLQADNAEATIDFLSSKFTNVELYDWMSGVLEKVYRVFLQQATATARLAASQLAFERQQLVTDYIQNDYWQAPVDNLLQSGTLPGDKTVDRKGITGSTRLLQDIYLLDQDAFSGDVRKFELTKTISLATVSPSEFQRFKSTGELPFELSMDPFDRDFPGHYLRLIRSVKISVIALVPPTDGIKAVLSNTGSSRVVIESGNKYQKIQVKRTPETVALTSATNSNGLFELNPANDTKLLPFEKTGVESQWIFTLPKASNFFDYSTIADVMLTVEYTALGSDLYRSKVIKEIGTDLKAYRSFSFKNNFADQWYDLSNPLDADASEYTVSFPTTASDFPANVKDILVDQVLMYFVASDTLDPEKSLDEEKLKAIANIKMLNGLSYQAVGLANEITTEGVEAVNGVISTTSLTGESWLIFRNKSIVGTWTLKLTKEQSLLIEKGYITDILFVITYKGQTAEF